MCPWVCQCREAGREFHKAIACITDEVRLSMKAAARGKEKITEHTVNASQEMHRISTGTKFGRCVEKFIGCDISLFCVGFCVGKSLGAMNTA